MLSGLFKNSVAYKLFGLRFMYIWYMYKQDLALNNL